MLRLKDLLPKESNVSSSLLYARSYPVNDKISVTIPTVGQILKDEDAYGGLITAVTSTPYDFMVQLDDVGIDFSKITSFELFLLLFRGLQEVDTSLVFGELDLSGFKTAVNEQNGQVVLFDEEKDIVIDRAIHDKISRILRQINHLKKNDQKPGNEMARKYMIERARIKQQRARRHKRRSQLEDLIVAMVNTEQYKYDFEGTLGLTIYQFNSCVYQVIKKINYDNTMIGYYTGSISAENISQDDLNWLNIK